MTTNREGRKKEIAKAIKLIGWYKTRRKIKATEDLEIFNELITEFDAIAEAEEDKRLKKAGISF